MEEAQLKTKFCKYCGQKIAEDAIICTHCGRQVEELKSNNKPDNIIINNSSSSSSSASASASASSANGLNRKRHSILFDLFMIFITGGLWIIWMIIRPKYY